MSHHDERLADSRFARMPKGKWCVADNGAIELNHCEIDVRRSIGDCLNDLFTSVDIRIWNVPTVLRGIVHRESKNKFRIGAGKIIRHAMARSQHNIWCRKKTRAASCRRLAV